MFYSKFGQKSADFSQNRYKKALNRNDSELMEKAGEEGFEPSAYGFGDRRSTS